MNNLIGFENGQLKNYTQEINQMTVMDTSEVNHLLISNIKEVIDSETQNVLTIQNLKKNITQQIRLTDKTLEIFSQFILALQGELDLSHILQVFPKEDQIVVDLNDYYKNQCSLEFIVNHTAKVLPEELKERVAQLITYMVNNTPEKKLDVSGFWEDEDLELTSIRLLDDKLLVTVLGTYLQSTFTEEDLIESLLKEKEISFWINLLNHVYSKFKGLKQ